MMTTLISRSLHTQPKGLTEGATPMPRYLYSYVELLGVLGMETPEEPGTDFGMSVWIDAPDEEAAFLWGNHLLEDYRRARFRFVPREESHGPEVTEHRPVAPRLEGWIEIDESILEMARECGYPVSRVGEIPEWIDPWRVHNARKDRRDGPQHG